MIMLLRIGKSRPMTLQVLLFSLVCLLFTLLNHWYLAYYLLFCTHFAAAQIDEEQPPLTAPPVPAIDENGESVCIRWFAIWWGLDLSFVACALSFTQQKFQRRPLHRSQTIPRPVMKKLPPQQVSRFYFSVPCVYGALPV